MKTHGLSVFANALVCALAVATGADAQSAGSAEAAELFKQGRAALEAKDYASACPKFVASLRLERAVGTLISLATCEQSIGKLANARQHWQEAADFADASHDVLNRGAYARKKFAEIDRRVPRLTVQLAAGAPKETSLRRGDIDLGATSFDAPLPLDPGPHTLVATALNHEPRSFSIELKEGEYKTIEVAPGAEMRQLSPASIVPAIPSPGAPSSSTNAVLASGPPPGAGPETSSIKPPTGRRLTPVTLALGGIGVVGLGAGTFFAVMSKRQDDRAAELCTLGPQQTECADGGEKNAFQDNTNKAKLNGTAAYVSFGVGAAALVTGAIVFLLSKPEGSASVPRITPMLARDALGLGLDGAW